MLGVACALVTAAPGCWYFLELDEKTFEGGGTYAFAAGEVCNPEVEIEATIGPERFCVDKYEITNAAYAAWLATKPPIGDRGRTECSFNDAFDPGDASAAFRPEWDADCAPEAYDFATELEEHPHRPVECVDFCDALTYCEDVGRHLCGANTDGGGPLDVGLITDRTAAEWYQACTGPDDRPYPYGKTFDGDRCNTSGGLAKVGSFDECEGANDGVFDMSGNATEWIDACDNTADNTPYAACVAMGGKDGTTPYSCKASRRLNRAELHRGVGIRCCRSPTPV